MFLCADDMIQYIENHKDPTQKLLGLINKCSKVAGYKTNIQKSVVFLYTNNEILESKIRIHFKITVKNITLRNKSDQGSERHIC